MTITFNPSELGMIKIGKDAYQINANNKLQDNIVIWGHLPFKMVSDYYQNELGVKVYIK